MVEFSSLKSKVGSKRQVHSSTSSPHTASRSYACIHAHHNKRRGSVKTVNELLQCLTTQGKPHKLALAPLLRPTRYQHRP
jgi:hypothetical protein